MMVSIYTETILYPLTVEWYYFYHNDIFHDLTAKYKINRGYLLFWDKYQIYFIECVEKSIISRVRSTSKIADIFILHEIKYF